MEEYGRYEFNQNQNQYQPVQPEAPKDPKKNHDNLKKFAKRAGAIALSAVLFGGIAGGCSAVHHSQHFWLGAAQQQPMESAAG